MKNDALKRLLENMIVGLRKQVEEKVPEWGTFPVVYERENVSEMKIGLSHLILKVSKVRFEGREAECFLELAAVNYPSPYGAESVVGFGSTKYILARLKEEDLVDVLMEKLKKLIEDIEYDEMHPWG